MRWTLVLFGLQFLSSVSNGARILGLFPYPGYSHFVVFQPLLDELAKRGHRLTVASFFPRETPLPNYEDVSFTPLLTGYNNNLSIANFLERPSNLVTNLRQIYDFLDNYEIVLSSKEFKSILERDFDLILTEAFNTEIFLALPYLKGTPFLALSSSDILPWTYSRFGNPVNPSFMPHLFSGYSDDMSFFERLGNFLEIIFAKFYYEFFCEPRSQEMAEKHFGPLPPLSDIAKNTSLILFNSYFTIHKPRPLNPTFIQVGGLGVRPPRKLPEDLEKLMNNSKDGVIYFSMGSLLGGSTFPVSKKQTLLKVFGKLNQTVLWKMEDETLDNPPNVHFRKWYPQNDILAHPKTVLFISHGGLLGLNEAVYHGVPIIGIPMFGDQEHNVGCLVSSNFGVRIAFHMLDENNLYDAIKQVLGNPMYKEKAVELSKQYKDTPASALDTAVFWTEYVLRHQGASHLQSAAVQLSWFQLYLLDIISFLILTLIIMLFFVSYFLKKVTQRSDMNIKKKKQ